MSVDKNQKIVWNPIAYMRVSKKVGMTVENQRPVLENWFKYQNIDLDRVKWMVEEESTRKSRVVQTEAFNLIKTKQYNMLACVRMDRWGRSSQELTSTVLEMVEQHGARVVFINNGMDLLAADIDASKKLVIRIFADFAEYERDLIQERTLAGLSYANSQGRFGGRPKGVKDKRPRAKAGYYQGWITRKHKEDEQARLIKLAKKRLNNEIDEKPVE